MNIIQELIFSNRNTRLSTRTRQLRNRRSPQIDRNLGTYFILHIYTQPHTPHQCASEKESESSSSSPILILNLVET